METFLQDLIDCEREKRREYTRKLAKEISNILFEEFPATYIGEIIPGSTTIWFEVGLKLLEPSEECSSSVAEECTEDMNEEECTKMFHECMEETMKEINEEHVIPIYAEVRTPEFEVEINPLEARGDYDVVGSFVEVNIKKPIEPVGDFARRIADLIKEILYPYLQ